MVAHAINKQAFEFTCGNEVIAGNVLHDVEHFTAAQINAVISSVLSEYDGAGTNIKIDKIEIDLGDIAASDFGTTSLLDKFGAIFRQKMLAIRNETGHNLREGISLNGGSGANEFEMVKSLLLYGDAPWWTDKTTKVRGDALLQKLIRRDPFSVKQLLEKYRENPLVLWRLQQQYNAQTHALVDSLVPGILEAHQATALLPGTGPNTGLSFLTLTPEQLLQLASIFRKHPDAPVNKLRVTLLKKFMLVRDLLQHKNESFYVVAPGGSTSAAGVFIGAGNKTAKQAKQEIKAFIERLTVFQMEFLLFRLSFIRPADLKEQVLDEEQPGYQVNQETGLATARAPGVKTGKRPGAGPAVQDPDTGYSTPASMIPAPGSLQETANQARWEKLQQFLAELGEGTGYVHKQRAAAANVHALQTDGTDRPLTHQHVSGELAGHNTPAGEAVVRKDGQSFFDAVSDNTAGVALDQAMGDIGREVLPGHTVTGKPVDSGGRVPGEADAPGAGSRAAYEAVQKGAVQKAGSDHPARTGAVEPKHPEPHVPALRAGVDPSLPAETIEANRPVSFDPVLPPGGDHSSRTESGKAFMGNRKIGFILERLNTTNPSLMSYLEQLSNQDLNRLAKSFRKHVRKSNERRKMINEVLAHPHFLKYGLLKIFASLAPGISQEEPGLKPSGAEALKPQKNILQPYAKNIRASQSDFLSVVNALTRMEAIVLKDILAKAQFDTVDEKKIMRKVISKLSGEGVLFLDFLTRLPEKEIVYLSSFIQSNPWAAEPAAGTPDTPGETRPSKIYIENAGLCLIAVYFNRLFKHLGYLENKTFKNKAVAGRAVLLLQYMATGKSASPEYVLQLNKLICGFEVEDILPGRLRLTKKEKAEADDLIRAVIENWKSLRSTSVDGFRGSFLQRKGILTENESHWTLQVERKGYDLLLDTIPWGYSMIKLPWMKKHIQVEWG